MNVEIMVAMRRQRRMIKRSAWKNNTKNATNGRP